MRERPTIKLRPKINAQKLRFGFPWIYQDQLVLDRRSRAIEAGSLVDVVDAEGRALGAWAFNAGSKITCRNVDLGAQDDIDAVWFKSQLERAATHRNRLFQEPFYRLIHAEADGCPGLIIDRFGDVFVVQPNAAWIDARFDALQSALIDTFAPVAIVKNAQGRARKLEGLDEGLSVTYGEVSGPLEVPMNGAIYKADVVAGQKTGLFFDQRPNHAFFQSLTEASTVLDVFSHVGGFSLAALAGGATHAVAVDASETALCFASEGAAALAASDRFETRKGDAFEVMAALGAEGQQFDAVVCDPPAFAPQKPALEAGLRAYERVARLSAGLVKPGGYLCLCSCSHAADLPKFRDASLRGIGKAGRASQIVYTGGAGADHPTHPYLAESAYLKALFLRLD
ncbi:MAG: class I SAM-dependent rRNA methyltransferase [Pseudomonadota bacterium]